MTTITGAQFLDFYRHNWPKGWYVEDMPTSIEDEYGTVIVTAEQVIDLRDCGYAQWEGDADGAHLLRGTETRADGIPMAEFYQRVMATTPPTALLVLKGSPEAIAAMRALAENAGLSIVEGA